MQWALAMAGRSDVRMFVALASAVEQRMDEFSALDPKFLVKLTRWSIRKGFFFKIKPPG